MMVKKWAKSLSESNRKGKRISKLKYLMLSYVLLHNQYTIKVGRKLISSPKGFDGSDEVRS